MIPASRACNVAGRNKANPDRRQDQVRPRHERVSDTTQCRLSFADRSVIGAQDDAENSPILLYLIPIATTITFDWIRFEEKIMRMFVEFLV